MSFFEYFYCKMYNNSFLRFLRYKFRFVKKRGNHQQNFIFNIYCRKQYNPSYPKNGPSKITSFTANMQNCHSRINKLIPLFFLWVSKIVTQTFHKQLEIQKTNLFRLDHNQQNILSIYEKCKRLELQRKTPLPQFYQRWNHLRFVYFDDTHRDGVSFRIQRVFRQTTRLLEAIGPKFLC